MHRAYRDARFGPGRQRGVGQRAGHPAHSCCCAARRRCFSAIRISPRSRSCRRWRRASTTCSSFLRDLARRAKPFAERDYAELKAFAAAELGLARSRAVGPRVRVGKAEGRSDSRFPSRRCAAIFRKTKCWRDCSASRRRSTASRSAASEAPTWHPDVRFFDVFDAVRRADRPVLPRRLRASGQAGRGVAGRRHQPPPHPARMSSFRWRTSRATSRRPPKAAARRSRTTKSSRSSTSSATGCTSS